jgi:signal transduction histidine kinase
MTETSSVRTESPPAAAGASSGRRALLILLFIVAAALVGWVEIATWRQLEGAKREFAEANLETFYLGLHLRETVLRMNGAVLRYQLSGDDAERDGFRREARELTERLTQTRAHLTTPAERELTEQVHRSYEMYLTEMAGLLERNLRGVRRDSASQMQTQIVAKSEALLGLAQRLVEAQRTALNRFFGSSGAVLGSLQRLLLISVVLLLGAVATIAVVVYRATVTPLRQQLHQSQTLIERQEKLAALGVLAAGVAHEVRNPLTAIKFRLFSLKNELPAGCADNEDLAVIHHEIDRLERIVRDFLQFARPSTPDKLKVDVEALLREVRDLLQPELQKRGVRVELEPVEPGAAASFVQGDRQQLQQVLINLIQNAADSIRREGVITLRVRAGGASQSKSTGPAVVLEVSDTGEGIPPEVEKRIFDPFFSTKEGGTGLGLAIAARIVENHDGFIQYSTRRQRGTTFSIVLPKVLPDERANPPH